MFTLVEIHNAEDYRSLQESLDLKGFEMGLLKWNDGKVYGLYHKDTGLLIWVGSTIRPLPQRKAGHVQFWKNCPLSSYTVYVMANGGPDKYEIRLIEKYPCHRLQELLDRERHFIMTLNPVCNINMRTPSIQVVNQRYMEEKKTVKLQGKGPFSRRYSDIQEISASEYAALAKRKFTVVADEYWQKEKYVFDKLILQTTSSEDRNAVFEAICTTADYSVRFILVYLEAVADPDPIYKQAKFCTTTANTRSRGLPAVRAICETLHLNSSHDTTTFIPHSLMERNAAALKIHLDDLVKTKYKSKISDGDKLQQDQLGVKLSKAIGRVMLEVSGFNTDRSNTHPATTSAQPVRKRIYTSRLVLNPDLPLMPRIIAAVTPVPPAARRGLMDDEEEI